MQVLEYLVNSPWFSEIISFCTSIVSVQPSKGFQKRQLRENYYCPNPELLRAIKLGNKGALQPGCNNKFCLQLTGTEEEFMESEDPKGEGLAVKS